MQGRLICQFNDFAAALTRTGKVQPGLVVLGYCLVEQRALGVARIVEFGFGGGSHEYCAH